MCGGQVEITLDYLTWGMTTFKLTCWVLILKPSRGGGGGGGHGAIVCSQFPLVYQVVGLIPSLT